MNKTINNSEIQVSFFVPCYNEEKNIINTLNCIKEASKLCNYEILVVDDCSQDKTIDMVNSFKELNKNVNVTLIKRLKNCGLGYNYFDTIKSARGKYYMLINGDNVEPIQAIKTIIDSLGTADMIIPNFGNADKRTLNRKIISYIFTTIINFISGNNIKYYNGSVLHNRKNLIDVSIYTSGYGYQAELICYLLKKNNTYKEVIIPNGDREWGTSKAFAIKNFINVGNSVIKILFRRLFNINH